MNTFVGLAALETAKLPAAPAVTVGTFDGVHIGHRALVAAARAAAPDASVVLTWDRHPAATLRPQEVPLLLTTPRRKAELIAGLGVGVLAILPFDTELSQWTPERFVQDVLVVALRTRVVIVGHGWRFGRRATGDVGLLADLGGHHGFSVVEVPLVEARGAPVSSTRVRRAIADGELDLARTLLGRPVDHDGIVIRGAHRGAALGFPTANIAPEPGIALPPRGVYAGRARVDGVWHAAATNIGVNPTFGGDPTIHPLRIESYLLDFAGDLYGKEVRIEFWARLRDEVAFEGADALVEQMRRDVEATRGVVA